MDVKKTILMVIDGWGEAEAYDGNAITNANTPVMDSLKENYPWTTLHACGEHVGLPEGGLGGSEVGHLTIGAGRRIYQPMAEINNSIKDGSFFELEPLKNAMQHVKATGGKLHLLGMTSDKGIHSDLAHMFALMEMAKKYEIEKVYIHAITDGRDVPEKSSKGFIQQILDKIEELGIGKIATIIGRYYAMDRDKNWERTQVAYDMMTLGKGTKETDPMQAIDNAYARGADTDYYIDAIVLDEDGLVNEKEDLIFFNFRTDRTAQLTSAFTEPEFNSFEYEKKVRPSFVCFGPYSKICPVVFVPENVKDGLGETVSKAGLKQLRIGETEKYAHVTFFFNGQRKEPYDGEDSSLVPSPKVESYDETPEMNADGVTREAIKGMEKGFEFILMNYSNADLVGHSGSYSAALKAVEFVDGKVGEVITSAKEHGYQILITADHGNADHMIYPENGDQCPSHSYSLVPAILVGEEFENKVPSRDGQPTPTSDGFLKVEPGVEGLSSIAPTILKMMGLKVPEVMNGKMLF
ncbi:MAG: 2,3-bisphosphoglycerate-independent phosphoglycerate mutase [Candidatus Peregrinibacteria bacterium]|nr:2,3-bisphosphoglycerate-independent phosphoglycerate mutase [Candidatus Peregrinibacteria bacterium]MDZ4244416.1 2,3-bisphosphoglycerate-independent phosphoglycerate mutase [Candidatus Gracilibacteria bacterium]